MLQFYSDNSISNTLINSIMQIRNKQQQILMIRINRFGHPIVHLQRSLHTCFLEALCVFNLIAIKNFIHFNIHTIKLTSLSSWASSSIISPVFAVTSSISFWWSSLWSCIVFNNPVFCSLMLFWDLLIASNRSSIEAITFKFAFKPLISLSFLTQVYLHFSFFLVQKQPSILNLP